MLQFNIMLTKTDWQTKTVHGIRLYHQGHTYSDQAAITIPELATDLAACKTADELIDFLPLLNGFYAWVEQSAGQVRAAVDHIRSRPLFYGLAAGRFYLSDDAEWVRQQVGDREMDPVAREEFQLAGYVTGADTLFPNVKQLQAGECLIVRQTDAGPVVETYRYYRFLHQEPTESSEPNLRAELDRVTVRVMQRLIDYANGRQIVIPLSGGYDSRLIATMLKRLGYENVITFSYGLADNKEAIFSRKVADSLGLPWLFVEYSNSLWSQAWSSPEAKAYREMAANHVSLPHVQDWLALNILVKHNQIEKNSILVPGHSGDFVAGSHIPLKVFRKKKHSYSDIVKSIIDIHLSNLPNKRMVLCKGKLLEKRVSDRINVLFDGTDVGFANLFELWDWQERQSKYIMNSVKVYEYHKLEWWTPFWDLDFVKFWEKVPLVLRKERQWFILWIKEQYAAYARLKEIEENLSNASDELVNYRLGRKVFRRLPISIQHLIRKTVHQALKRITINRYHKHFLAFGGLVPKNMLQNYLKLNYNIIGIYSDLYLKKQWDDIHGW